MEQSVRLAVAIEAFSYADGTEALRDIALELHRGEFIGILGSNGSGKTTLLKAMDGLERGYRGTVLLDGQDMRKLSAKDIYARMGLVFQNPDEQLFAPTVYEDVSFGPLNMGFDRDEVARRVNNALSAVGMQHVAGRAIHRLSFGQKKRVCIAGLLAMGHEILLLDEPTAGLDPLGEYAMMELLTRLNREQRVSIVMATHSVDLVPLALDRLYILSNGRIARSGSPTDVFTAPDEMTEVKLRLPQIAELIWRLKNEDSVPFGKIPLTVGEARRELLAMMKGRHA